MVRAKDIAARVGLSQPTVSRILNGTTGYKVAARTRELVLSTAQSMGYRPNILARSLRSKRTGVVGVYVDTIYYSKDDVLGCIHRSLVQAGVAFGMDMLMLRPVTHSSMTDLFGQLGDGRTDGILVYLAPESPIVGHLIRSPFPVVAVANTFSGLPSVGYERVRCTDHLSEAPWARMAEAALGILMLRVTGKDAPVLTLLSSGIDYIDRERSAWPNT